MLRDKFFFQAKRSLLTAICLSFAWHSSTANGFTESTSEGAEPAKYAYIDKHGNQAFDSLEGYDRGDFADKILALRADNSDTISPCSYFDIEGKLIGKEFERGHPFSEGLARVGEREKVGFIDNKCKIVIKPIFRDALSFHEGLAPVMVNNRFGFINRAGTIVIEPFFEDVSGFSEGLAAVRSQGKIGFIDKSGAWRIKPRYKYVNGFSDGLALVRNDVTEDFIDTSGQVVITLSEEQMKRPFQTTGVSNSGLSADLQGFNSGTFADICVFHDGLAPMVLTNKYGYIDKTGGVAISPNFDRAYPFSDGLAWVVVNNKWGIINKAGKFILEPIFARAEDFHEGAAAVAVGHHKWGYVDTLASSLCRRNMFVLAGSAMEGPAFNCLGILTITSISNKFDSRKHVKVLSSPLSYLRLSFMILVAVLFSLKSESAPSSSTNAGSPDEFKQELFLQSIAPSIRPWRNFGENAKVWRETGIVNIFSSDAEVNKAACVPICVSSHRLTFAEFFETLARQTGTSVHFESKSNTYNFEKPPMPLQYSISIADGWHMKDHGYYVAYTPSIAPVGMDIYMMGRFVGLSDEKLREIRNEQALTWGDKASPGINIEDMTVKTVDGSEALYLKTKAPIKGRQWRQWAFVKNGQAFVIVSAVADENESTVIPDVEKMVASFHVI